MAYHPCTFESTTLSQSNRTLSSGRAAHAACLVLVLATGAVSAAFADLPGKHPVLNKRFRIGVGGFFPGIDSNLQLDGSDTPGTNLDFEDLLALEDSANTLWATADWHISKRHGLEFEFVQLNRSNSLSGTSEEYQVGDTLLQVGGNVDTTFDVSLYRLTYGFSLIRSDATQLQIHAGAHLADVSASLELSGELTVDGQVFEETVSTEGGSLTAPLPHLGGSITQAITERFALNAHIIGFALEVEGVEGSIIEGGFGAEWSFGPRFGLGAGGRYFKLSVDDEGEGQRERFEFRYFGPTVYFYGTF